MRLLDLPNGINQAFQPDVVRFAPQVAQQEAVWATEPFNLKLAPKFQDSYVYRKQ